jgi:tRNA A-37 threonylcarbamoyl transferase component Bud32
VKTQDEVIVEIEALPPPGRPAAVRARAWLEDQGELASGGMGSIRRVRHRDLRHVVAMKVLEPSFARQLLHRRRFIEEAQITGQLDHPNIPPVHDLWIDHEGDVRFTMKLMDGRTLADLLEDQPLEARTDLDLERFLGIFVKVCEAVSFAHSRGVIHRDLKPENIMVGDHGRVWVMDWGCAKLLPVPEGISVARNVAAESLDPPEVIIGTPSFLAPEQASGLNDRVDERTDVYLLGGVLYNILTLQLPHRGSSLRECVQSARQGLVSEPQSVAGEVPLPPELCRIAMRALQADPDLRYATVSELREDVDRSLRQGWWFRSTTFDARAVVVREGEPADAAYIITDGTCEAFRLEGGRRVVLRRMGPGDTFGETAIFADRRRTASVQATEPLTAVVVTRDALERALARQSWIGAFVGALARRFGEHDERLAELRMRAQEGGPGADPP